MRPLTNSSNNRVVGRGSALPASTDDHKPRVTMDDMPPEIMMTILKALDVPSRRRLLLASKHYFAHSGLVKTGGIRVNTCDGLRKAVETSKAAIRELSLCGDDFANADLHPLAALTNLNSLAFRNCKGITERGIENIPCTVAHLKLSGCYFKNATVEQLLSRLPQLKKLVLEDCPAINDDVIEAIPRTLESLSIGNCGLINPEAVQNLLTEMNNLKSLKLRDAVREQPCRRSAVAADDLDAVSYEAMLTHGYHSNIICQDVLANLPDNLEHLDLGAGGKHSIPWDKMFERENNLKQLESPLKELMPLGLEIFPHEMEHVNFSGMISVANATEQFIAFFSRLTQLKHLELTNDVLDNHGICGSVPDTLQELVLPEFLTDEFVQTELPHLLDRLVNLTSLKFKAPDFEIPEAQKLEITKELVEHLPEKLERLEIQSCTINHETLISLCSKLPNLRHLGLPASMEISEEITEHLPQQLEVLKCAESLLKSEAFEKLVTKARNLNYLELPRTFEITEEVLESCPKLPELGRLVLMNSELTPSALVSLLSKLPALQCLELPKGLKITEDLAKNLRRTLEYKNLSTCIVQGGRGVLEVLSQLSNLGIDDSSWLAQEMRIVGDGPNEATRVQGWLAEMPETFQNNEESGLRVTVQ